MPELEKSIYVKIKKLCKEGDAKLSEDHFDDAVSLYTDALMLIPEPIENWEASTWILSAIGDVYFLAEDYEEALNVFTDAMNCPNAVGNPFLHKRLGQCHYEMNDYEAAADEMARAYMSEGDEIFQNENPKYFEFLKTKIKT